MRIGDKINVTCLDNGKIIPAVLHKLSKDSITVVINAGAATITLLRKNDGYIGSKGGLEFKVFLKETQ